MPNGSDVGAALSEATSMNPAATQSDPQKMLALAESNLPSTSMAGAAGYMSLMAEFHRTIKSAATTDVDHPAHSLWSSIWSGYSHFVDGMTNAMPNGVDLMLHGAQRVSNQVANTPVGGGYGQFANDVVKALPGGADTVLHGAEGIANRVTGTAVELGSLGTRSLNFNKGFMPHMETTPGGFNLSNVETWLTNQAQGGVNGNLVSRLSSAAGGQGFRPLGTAVSPYQIQADAAVTKAKQALSAYRANPTPEAAQAVNGAITEYNQAYAKCSLGQVATLADASATLQNADPVNLLVGPNNMFFMASHTAAYTESYAAKYGWGAAVGHLLPAVALAVMTDGALSADVAGVGTAEYDATLLSEAAKTFDQGQTLTADEQLAVEQAQGRVLGREMAGNARATYQSQAEETVATLKSGMSPMMRNLYRGGEVVGMALKPLTEMAKPIMAVGSDVRMNLMYQMVQLQAHGDPSTAALWNQTSDLQARDAQGQKVGQDGTALLKGMNLDPHGMAFSILSPVAGLTDFYTKWLAADPFGAYGNVMGQARSADGLKGYLGQFFGGLRITDVASAFRAGDQYPQVRSTYTWLARTDSPAEIGTEFPGTYTSAQRVGLAQLHTYDEVATWHGHQAEALNLLRPMAPQMGVYQLLKADLRGSLGEYLRLHGSMNAYDMKYVVDNYSEEELRAVHIDPAQSVDEVLSPSLRVQASLGRWLGTRLGSTAMYWDEILGKMQNHVFNLASDNAVKAEMDLFRVALFPEKLVKLIGNAAEGATESERLVLYQKAAFHAVQRRMWAGLTTASSVALKDVVDQLVWREVRNATGLDGGGHTLGAEGAGADMAGPGGMSQVFKSTEPDALAVLAAIRREQRGQITFFAPRVMRGLAVTVRRIVQDLPPDALSAVEAFTKSRSELEAALTYTGDTVEKALARIDGLATTPERGVIGSSRDATQAYRAALGESREIIAAHQEATGIHALDGYLNAYDHLVQKTLGIEQLRSIVGEREMAERAMAPGSTELLAEQERLRAMLPAGFGITSLDQLDARMMRRLLGQAEGFNAVIDQFARGFSDSGQAVNDLRTTSEEYKRFVTGNPNAQVDLEKIFTQRFEAEAKRTNQKFLNSPQAVVDKLNGLLSRTFVPAALFSGAWSFHIAVSESSLNILREGFGPFFEAKLMKSIVNHAQGDRTIGAVALEPVVQALGNRFEQLGTGDALSRTGEVGTIARVVSHTLLGALDLIKLAREAQGGLFMGFNRVLLAGMDQEQMDRMMADFVNVNMYHNGAQRNAEINHLKDTYSGVKGVTANMAYGYDRINNEPTISHVVQGRQWRHADASDPAYLSGLHDWMNYVSHSDVERPIVDALYQEVHAVGVEGLDAEVIASMTDQQILERGALKFTDRAEYDALFQRLQRVAYDHIHALPADFRATMERDTGLLSLAHAPRDEAGNISTDPHEHWAKAAVYDVLNTVGGERSLVGSTAHVIHGNLLSQVNSGDIKPVMSLAHDLSDITAGEEPNAIPVRLTYTRKLERTGLEKATGWIASASDLGHHYVFGPIANNIVRDPLFSLDYHLEMERLRASGMYSDIQMQTMAETNAAMRLTRFVHNPLDKMVVESNMRVVAPFYFAQNQAWRRAFRVLHEDPGAFEKYLKEALGVTQWVSVQTKNGAAPLIHIPFTNFIGWMAAHVPMRNFWSSPYLSGVFDTLGFNLSGSPGSVSSMDPLGAVYSPTGIAGNIGRPSWGPIFTLPVELTRALLNMHASSHPLLRDIVGGINATLGPAANAGGLAGQLDPSSIGRAVEGLLHGLGVWGSPQDSASFMSEYLLVMQNGADNLMTKFVAEAKTKYIPLMLEHANLPDTAANRGTLLANTAASDYIVGQASKMFADYFKDPAHYTNFTADARGAALTLQVTKIFATVLSPLSPSVQATFTKEPDFLKIEAEKTAAGKPKYPVFQAAYNELAQRAPGHSLDITSRSNSGQGAWPETNQTVAFAAKYPSVIATYGYAAAFLQNDPAYSNGGKFNISAYALLTNLNLRTRDTPKEFLDALMIKSGQGYYNWVLKPEYGTDYSGLKQAAQNFGLTENAQWLAYHTGSQYVARDVRTLDQMAVMVKDKSIPNAAFYPGTAAQGRGVAAELSKVVSAMFGPVKLKTVRDGFDYLTQLGHYEIQQYGLQHSNSRRNTYAYNFYGQMQTLATEVPVEYRSYVTYILQGILNRSNL